MGSNDSDDDAVTEINVEVDPSMISEITITRTGASPITALSGSASPADSEPTTLEPQLGVRGLGTRPSSSRPPPAFAPIPAAGRPPEPSDWDGEASDVTVHRGPDAPDGQEVADAIRASGDAYEEETKTDAVHSDLIALSRAQAPTVPRISEDPVVEAQATRDGEAPLTMASVQAVFMDPPLRVTLVDAERAKLDAQAAVGGTVRMLFNPVTNTVSAVPESGRSLPAAPRAAQPFGEQPTVQALPLQQNPKLGAPAIVREASPASLEATHGSRGKPRRAGRLVLLFVVACGASGAGVHYRNELRPWITARVPSGWRAPVASAAAAASASASASASPSATVEASAGVSAIATPPASASVATDAGPSAAASSSAQRKNKKGTPPRR